MSKFPVSKSLANMANFLTMEAFLSFLELIGQQDNELVRVKPGDRVCVGGIWFELVADDIPLAGLNCVCVPWDYPDAPCPPDYIKGTCSGVGLPVRALRSMQRPLQRVPSGSVCGTSSRRSSTPFVRPAAATCFSNAGGT